MVVVIGAGPVGSYAGYLLASKGHKVKIFEEHKAVGKPVACTGLVTSQLKKVVRFDEDLVVNRCKNIRINYFEKDVLIKLSKPNLVLDRQGFDQFFAELALSQGVELNLNSKVDKILKGSVLVSGKKYSYDYLVGADGPNSLVGRYLNGKRQRFVVGAQARVRFSTDPETIDVWLNHGEFSWVVPEDEKYARVGVVAKARSGQILKKMFDELKIKGVENWQSGVIPLYDPFWKIQDKNVLAVGDAAGQVKATTYGGLVFGMKAASLLSKGLKRYSYNVNKTLSKDLLIALLLRRVLNKFSHEDFVHLMDYFSSTKLKRVLDSHDRDYPSRFMFKLLRAEPRLLYFLRTLFR